MTIECNKSTTVNAIVIAITIIGVIALTTSYLYMPPHEEKKAPKNSFIVTVCWDLNGTRLLCENRLEPCEDMRVPYNTMVSSLQFTYTALHDMLRFNRGFQDNDFVHLIKSTSCNKATPTMGKVDTFGLYFAYAVIAAVPFGLCIMLLYAATTNRGNTPNLAGYHCGACLFMCSPLALGLYFFFQTGLYKEVIFYTRASLLIVACVLACVIFWCMFRSSITASFITHTTTYWSNGTVTRDTSRDDFGYVDCREWHCLV